MYYYCRLQPTQLQTVYYICGRLFIQKNKIIIQSSDAASMCQRYFMLIPKSQLSLINIDDFMELIMSQSNQASVIVPELFLKDKNVVFTNEYQKNINNASVVIDFNTGTIMSVG